MRKCSAGIAKDSERSIFIASTARNKSQLFSRIRSLGAERREARRTLIARRGGRMYKEYLDAEVNSDSKGITLSDKNRVIEISWETWAQIVKDFRPKE